MEFKYCFLFLSNVLYLESPLISLLASLRLFVKSLELYLFSILLVGPFLLNLMLLPKDLSLRGSFFCVILKLDWNKVSRTDSYDSPSLVSFSLISGKKYSQIPLSFPSIDFKIIIIGIMMKMSASLYSISSLNSGYFSHKPEKVKNLKIVKFGVYLQEYWRNESTGHIFYHSRRSACLFPSIFHREGARWLDLDCFSVVDQQFQHSI